MMTPKTKSVAPKPFRWLLMCARSARQWIAISVVLGIAGGLLMIVQARGVARIIHATVMEGAHREDLLPLFALLLILVGARAVLGWGRESAGFQAGARISSAGGSYFKAWFASALTIIKVAEEELTY